MRVASVIDDGGVGVDLGFVPFIVGVCRYSDYAWM